MYRLTKLIVLSFTAFVLLSFPAFAQEHSTGQTTEEIEVVKEVEGEKTALIQITDPEITASEDEEPDCE